MRRYAIALLTKLILTHPYGVIHGGYLNVNEWQERYREVVAELTSLEQRPVDEGAPAEEEEDEEGDGEGDGEDEEDESAILKYPGVTVDEDGEIDMNTVDRTVPSAKTRTSKGSKLTTGRAHGRRMESYRKRPMSNTYKSSCTLYTGRAQISKRSCRCNARAR